MIAPDELKRTIETGVDGCQTVVVTDLTGTQDHYQAVIVAGGFEGKLPLARHRMVYAALGDLMSGPVHALTLETLTPAEYAKKSSLT